LSAARYPWHRQAQLPGEKHGSTPISTVAQSHAPMVALSMHKVASLVFWHEAHGWQSVGHCPGNADDSQYPPIDCPPTTDEQGALHMLQLSA
jgi:hypothetical protein